MGAVLLALIKLYLPALIPSWRFFKDVAPSPRIEVRVGDGDWREYRDLPQRITPLQMLLRLVWNPGWTEHLFLVSCAERLIVTPTQHSVDEFRVRLTRLVGPPRDARLQFRLRFVCREGDQIVSYIEYESEAWRADEL